MAAPVWVRVTGKTAVANVTVTPTNIISNPASSGQIYKINALIIANIDGVNSADISSSLYRSSVEYFTAKTIPVPADSSMVLIDKSNEIYLEEGDAIRLTASANGDLQAVCSYEVIN